MTNRKICQACAVTGPGESSQPDHYVLNLCPDCGGLGYVYAHEDFAKTIEEILRISKVLTVFNLWALNPILVDSCLSNLEVAARQAVKKFRPSPNSIIQKILGNKHFEFTQYFREKAEEVTAQYHGICRNPKDLLEAQMASAMSEACTNLPGSFERSENQLLELTIHHPESARLCQTISAFYAKFRLNYEKAVFWICRAGELDYCAGNLFQAAEYLNVLHQKEAAKFCAIQARDLLVKEDQSLEQTQLLAQKIEGLLNSLTQKQEEGDFEFREIGMSQLKM